MTFRTHTERHEVETGQLIRFQSETHAQIILILRGRFHRVRFLTLDAMHLLFMQWDLENNASVAIRKLLSTSSGHTCRSSPKNH
jgi:hypothetical protein